MKRDLRPVELVCECDCWCFATVYRGAVDRRPDPVPSCEACQDGEHVDAPADE